MITVAVQQAPFSVEDALAPLEALGGGAVASFVGLVRSDGGIEALTLEHYPGMTEVALRRLAEEAVARWSLIGATVIHRVGELRLGERIVLVATCAPHRRDALDACAYLIDRLKTDAPFWKRETRGGDGRWVEARASDDAAAARWSQPSPQS
ncbi:molybdopterin synthase catalytic subunit [Sphingomonas sp. MAH-20]|uniref:Molybdopterin synthase catalytic subunit n=1 Tax=Sphingomonas horti TaxID=2682842 RepID=A0A6I4IYR5_9SPHN|nr:MULTISPECIES: molybdenum cofactor biosynthesis protein MoaE [Sphingomonas]MBA2918249.1 molybdenum cofactor biosynthesis protein MoaE [Sphingomonas sp. CGMCC 1.13658]MVO77216.1 molybdopterin synthase catalytic subunit [Sphingomonas horti]